MTAIPSSAHSRTFSAGAGDHLPQACRFGNALGIRPGLGEQFVAADDPDLVLTYTNGRPEGLDALLTSIRRRTTADVIVPASTSSRTVPQRRGRGARVVDWDRFGRSAASTTRSSSRIAASWPATCARSGRSSGALVDAVHQNRHGVIRIWDNIVRHIGVPDASTGPPDVRERHILAASTRSTPRTKSPSPMDGPVKVAGSRHGRGGHPSRCDSPARRSTSLAFVYPAVAQRGCGLTATIPGWHRRSRRITSCPSLAAGPRAAERGPGPATSHLMRWRWEGSSCRSPGRSS